MTYLSRLVPGMVVLLSFVQTARADIFLVTVPYDTTDAVPGDGVCADAQGHCSLRAAVQESNALAGPDIIELPAGTYTLSLPGNAEHAAATGDLDLLDDVTVRGQGADRTVVDAAGVDRAFEAISAGTVLIEDLTIENGVAGANTPGYFAVNSGGAISVVGNTSTLTLRHVVLRNNQAQSGGGLFNVFSTVKVYDSTLSGNFAADSGGGIAESLAAYTELYNVTLSGNRAAQNGGGMLTSNNTPLFYNVTVTGNLADSNADGNGDGGGVYQGIAAPTLVNSIIAGNLDAGGEAPDCAGAITSNGYNLIGDNTGCSITAATGDQIGTAIAPVDPGLQPLSVAQIGVPVHALDPSSPAIDAGNPAVPGSGGDACLGTDVRGAQRAINTPCDIGAYEAAVFGRTFSVTSTNDRVDANPGDGVCETAAGNNECTLRAAIQEANALDGVDTIVVPAGTIGLTLAGAGEDLSATGDLDITEAVRIIGAGMNLTIIDGGGLDRVFQLSTTGRVEMSGMTIRNGAVASSQGGGILLQNTGGMDLTDVRVTGNSARHGGGIYAALWSWMDDGMVNLTRCDISANTASQYGGGFANFTFRASKIVDSTLNGNSAQIGGGLFNSFMSMALVTGSTISGNQAQSGGGIAMLFGNGVVTLVNSTLSGNTATLAGGGVNVPSNDRINLFSTTVTANRAAGMADGGGIYSTGAAYLANTVLASNIDDDATAPDCAATLNSLGNNFIGNDAGCTIAATGTDRVGTQMAPLDPHLGALASYGGSVAYHLPLDDSPLLNAGNSALPGSAGGCPATDLRGVDRRLNAPCDIGAVERRTVDVAVTASVTPAVMRAGEVDYDIQVTNAGPDTATAVTLTLTPPAGAGYAAVAGTGWSCAEDAGNIVCHGTDLPSDTASDLTLTLTVADTNGTVYSSLNVGTGSWDINTANNSYQLGYTSAVSRHPAGGGLGIFSNNPTEPVEVDDEEVVTEDSVVTDMSTPSEYMPEPVNPDLEQALNQTEDMSPQSPLESMSGAQRRSSAVSGGTEDGSENVNGARQSDSVNFQLEEASVASAEFWGDISAMRERMAAAAATDTSGQELMLYTAKTLSAFLFAGATNWYFKGGSLLAGLFSSMPLWTPFDPLPILALSRRMRRRRKKALADAAALELRYSAGITHLLDMTKVDVPRGAMPDDDKAVRD